MSAAARPARKNPSRSWWSARAREARGRHTSSFASAPTEPPQRRRSVPRREKWVPPPAPPRRVNVRPSGWSERRNPPAAARPPPRSCSPKRLRATGGDFHIVALPISRSQGSTHRHRERHDRRCDRSSFEQVHRRRRRRARRAPDERNRRRLSAVEPCCTVPSREAHPPKTHTAFPSRSSCPSIGRNGARARRGARAGSAHAPARRAGPRAGSDGVWSRYAGLPLRAQPAAEG